MAENGVVRGPHRRGTDEAASRAAARPQPSQTGDCARVSPAEESGSPMVLDAYDPFRYGILVIVLTAVTHLLLQALDVDATLQLFNSSADSWHR